MTNIAVKYGIVGVAGNKRKRMKKIMLWMLLVLQICLIFCFWCMPTGYTEHTTSGTTSNHKLEAKKQIFLTIAANEKIKASPFSNGVNFVTKAKRKPSKTEQNEMIIKNANTLENVNNFTRDYIKLETYRLMNITGIEAEIDNDYEIGITKDIWCFRQGTIFEANSWQIYWNMNTQQLQCKCQRFWHGKDCSQNEVVYRALMLPQNQLKELWKPFNAQQIHLLVYIIEGYFCSLEFLELQISSLKEVVDHFCILWKSSHLTPKLLKGLKHKLHNILPPERFTLYQCATIKCNRTKSFAYFHEKLNLKFKNNLQSTDLLLYTNENVVLSKDILIFFKYNANIVSDTQMAPWQFRLKYNVYGFFWQHPSKTFISGFLSSLSQLGDPIRLNILINKKENNDGSRIMGDLNHFGGWYCQYCAHPDEIIKELNELQAENATSEQIKEQHQLVKLPSARNSFIDSKYLENIISEGLHIDGKTRLEKNRPNTDAYYAPAYVEKFKWKFGNLLLNLFEAIDNDYILEEAEGGFGF